jgi:hypothetical protein
MKFDRLSQGFVHRTGNGKTSPVAVHSRCAVTRGGDVLCHYVLQEKLGQNDFRPCLARSRDGGLTWHSQLLWPHLHANWSIIGNLSRSPRGDIFLGGARTRIDRPGESFWCDATQGMKPNDLIWARSRDDGATWGEPGVIPNPIPGCAEATAPLLATTGGIWVTSFAPYNTFDSNLAVPRNQLVGMWSDDEGRKWQHTAVMKFPHDDSSAAGHSIVELSDGRLLGVTWHINETFPKPPPNAYALSNDHGRTWGATLETGIHGQSTGLAALPDGGVLLVYTQRKHREVGIWLALTRPTENDFGIEADEIIWKAETPTQSSSSGEHSSWTDFAFGAPSVVLLSDGTLLATLWCIQPSGSGIRYVKLRMNK